MSNSDIWENLFSHVGARRDLSYNTFIRRRHYLRVNKVLEEDALSSEDSTNQCRERNQRKPQYPFNFLKSVMHPYTP
jgi:hypothetical protein